MAYRPLILTAYRQEKRHASGNIAANKNASYAAKGSVATDETGKQYSDPESALTLTKHAKKLAVHSGQCILSGPATERMNLLPFRSLQQISLGMITIAAFLLALAQALGGIDGLFFGIEPILADGAGRADTAPFAD
jgi:hypothetical protein